MTRLLTIKEASGILHLSRATLFRMARVGKIEFVRFGPRSNRIKECDVKRLVERGTR